jgi:hypothetical protein
LLVEFLDFGRGHRREGALRAADELDAVRERLPTNAHHLDPSLERSKLLSGTGQQPGGANLLGRQREESVDLGAFPDVLNRAPQCRPEIDPL